MALSKSQKASKDNQAEEQNFIQQYRDATKKSKHRRDTSRTKLRRDHHDKHEELRSRIKNLERRSLTDRPDGSGAHSPDKTGLDAMRDLLDRKTDVEKRIIKSIQSLELAMKTTSTEICVTLKSRAAEAAAD